MVYVLKHETVFEISCEDTFAWTHFPPIQLFCVSMEVYSVCKALSYVLCHDYVHMSVS